MKKRIVLEFTENEEKDLVQFLFLKGMMGNLCPETPVDALALRFVKELEAAEILSEQKGDCDGKE